MGHHPSSTTMANNNTPSSSYSTKLTTPYKKLRNSLNKSASNSIIGKYFKLTQRKTTLTTELFAATSTFLTMIYIISVNATIIADSGATCSLSDCTLLPNQTIPSPDCVLKPNIGYSKCLSKVKADLVTSTCVSALISSVSMGVLANLPLALAPGMGPNAYLTYNLVGYHGTGSMSYETALAVVLIEGCVFLLLAVVGFRAKLARLIPNPVRLACAAGIGLFIAFTGLQSHLGLGLIGPDPSNLVTLTACKETDPVTGACISGTMRSPTFWLGTVGLFIICFLQMKNVKGGMVIGILFVTFVSWFRGTEVTYFPHTPLGDASFDYFKKVIDFHPIKSVAGAISFSNFNRSEVWIALITLLYVDVLGTTGTLYTMAEIGGFVDEKGEFENEYTAYMVDAGATIVGAGLGVTPIAVFIESSVGIKEGGRTGLTAVFVGMYFFLSLFLTPLMTSVPGWAIGGPLVMVGLMMMKVMKDIDWGNIKEAMPAFITIVLMPLSYSISNGIIGGIGSYIALHSWDWGVGLFKKGLEMKRKVVREENQVSAAAAAVHGGGAVGAGGNAISTATDRDIEMS